MTTNMISVCSLLLLVAVGSFVNTEDNYDFDDEYDYGFEGEVARGRRGFSCLKMGSICFDATHFNVSQIVKEQGFCDNFKGGHEDYDLSHRHICPHITPYCCVNCGTTQQDDYCKREVKRGSIARRECCTGELFFGPSRLGCKCCKKCIRKQQCRSRHGFCVNPTDPVFNNTACLAGFPGTDYEGEYILKLRGCVGYNCHCCQPKHIPNATTLAPAN
ncbi:unnamed protein product [Meganyctiphanes norvegica]|uniref:Uncharacterized protein n=1 Tax=Meganyctiphanes norvegica TaxID=48144 RepID=A0AAV2PQD2_MEGNR